MKGGDFIKKISEAISEKAELPKELLMNIPRIALAGDRELFLENYRSLVEYTQSLIRVSAPDYCIRISGRNLKITQINGDNLFIEGIFDQITLER